MMPIYCLCEAKNDKPDSQAFMAPNRYCSIESNLGGKVEDVDFPPLALYVQMKCIKTGANQVLLDGGKRQNDWSSAERPLDWRNHYPNVDVFECPNCGARIVRG
jgi:hypothetical protein